MAYGTFHPVQQRGVVVAVVVLTVVCVHTYIHTHAQEVVILISAEQFRLVRALKSDPL